MCSTWACCNRRRHPRGRFSLARRSMWGADKGYFRTEDIAACEKAGLIPHVPRPQRGSAVREGFFRKDEFRYDAERDAYVCPAGQILTPIRHGRLRDMEKIDYANPKACRDCPLRARCPNDVRS